MRITVEHLNVSYATQGRGENQVLHDVCLEAKSGRRLCVMGANGSGKTTLLRALIGAIPYTGTVCYDGTDLRQIKRKAIGQKVAVLTQMNRAYFSYTVEETVTQARFARNRSFFLTQGKEDRAVIERVLETTGLTKVRREPIDRLSGGQLQRVFLARTLAQETPVILLDEPTNHLDLKYQEELLTYLEQWSKEKTTLPDGQTYNNTVIGVFHDINLACLFAQDVCLLKEGRVLAVGARDEVLTAEHLREAFDTDVPALLRRLSERWQ